MSARPTAAPSGVVTFLFTDAEGSTHGGETDADGMRKALAAHDEVLCSAIEVHGGFRVSRCSGGMVRIDREIGSATLSGDGKGTATRPHHSRWSQLVRSLRFPKGHEMKVLGVVAATAIALAPFSVVATAPGVAQAAPCSGQFANPTSCNNCLVLVEAYHTPNVCDRPALSRPAQVPPSSAPVQIPEAPPLPVLPEPAPPSVAQVVPPSPAPPRAIPVQTPKIKPLAPGAPSASPVTPPKALDAPPQAIAAAKAAPATRVNPGINQMLQLVDFNHQVQSVVDAHNGNVDVVKADNQALARPRHWDYIDYDAYHRPTLYNPLNQAMTFRYFYNGAYREAYVPAGGRIVIDAAAVGVFPFTAVGESYLASGSFYGGAWIPPPDGWNGPPPPDYTPPPRDVYEDVVADVPAADQTVEAGQVEVVGHDDSQPAGSQDTFLLDDSTLAWGQINDPSSSVQISVTKTQSLPGVGPTDNGSFLVALANYKESQPTQPWWPSAVGYGLLAIAVCAVAWMIGRGDGAWI